MESYTVPELKKLAKQRGYTGYSKMRKVQLIALLKGKPSSTKKTKRFPCKVDQVLNPASNRCVSKSGRIGQKLLKGGGKSPIHKPNKKILHDYCPQDKILNPATGRCVLKTGKIGNRILADSEPSDGTPIVESDFWLVYTKQGCPYCVKSAKVLSRNKKLYKTIRISPENEEEFIKNMQKIDSNIQTFPVIFHNNIYIGGYSDLEMVFGTDVSQSPQNKSVGFILPKSKKHWKATAFRGDIIHEMAAFLYLMERHKNDCAVMAETLNIVKTKSFEMYQIEFMLDDNRLNVPPNYWKYVTKCKGKRFYMMPMGIVDYIYGSHSNILIYDSKTKSLERFEPHGDSVSMYPSTLLDKAIVHAFRKNLGKGFIKHYYKPLDFCPVLSFQRLQKFKKEKQKGDPGGFCAAWSYWYANLRLSNPDMDRKDVIDKAISEINASNYNFTQFIRSYSRAMEKYTAELRKSKNPSRTFRQYAKLFSD